MRISSKCRTLRTFSVPPWGVNIFRFKQMEWPR
jgi:hypothetical protein